MNKVLLTAVVVVCAAALPWSTSATAQDGEDRVVPVEFFACEYQDGKNMGDLKEVIAKFNKWADKNDSTYSAWTLTPQFHSGVDFDVGWMGVWPDGKAFGVSQDTWMKGGKDIAREFNKVVDCGDRHELLSSATIHAPGGPGDDGVVMFSACTLKEGKTFRDSFEAHKKLAKAMAAKGNKAKSWLFYPGVGAGEIDFHYWRVLGFNNYTEFGEAAEIFLNEGGWEIAMKTLGPVVSCKQPAAFDARLARKGKSS